MSNNSSSVMMSNANVQSQSKVMAPGWPPAVGSPLFRKHRIYRSDKRRWRHDPYCAQYRTPPPAWQLSDSSPDVSSNSSGASDSHATSHLSSGHKSECMPKECEISRSSQQATRRSDRSGVSALHKETRNDAIAAPGLCLSTAFINNTERLAASKLSVEECKHVFSLLKFAQEQLTLPLAVNLRAKVFSRALATAVKAEKEAFKEKVEVDEMVPLSLATSRADVPVSGEDSPDPSSKSITAFDDSGCKDEFCTSTGNKLSAVELSEIFFNLSKSAKSELYFYLSKYFL